MSCWGVDSGLRMGFFGGFFLLFEIITYKVALFFFRCGAVNALFTFFMDDFFIF